jgi:putative FmdB family regulatory protein
LPTYGYRCQSCGSEFEVLRRMSDPAVAACPSCNGAGKRLFYPAGILFRGSGFYKTDSRGKDGAVVKNPTDGKPAGTPSSPSTAIPGAATSEPGSSAPAKASPEKPASTGKASAAPAAPSSD